MSPPTPVAPQPIVPDATPATAARAIAALDETERAVLGLLTVEGCTPAEAAHVLGLPEREVRRLHAGALAALAGAVAAARARRGRA